MTDVLKYELTVTKEGFKETVAYKGQTVDRNHTFTGQGGWQCNEGRLLSEILEEKLGSDAISDDLYFALDDAVRDLPWAAAKEAA